MGCWHLLFHLILMFLTSAAAAEAISIAKPGCPDKCGNVSIPYPFGIKHGCFREDQHGFQLFCDDTSHPPKLFLPISDSNMSPDEGTPVRELSLEGEATVTFYIASDCYNKSGISGGYPSRMRFSETGPFTFSNTHNKFIATGCDTKAFIRGYLGPKLEYTGGCLSFCLNKESVRTGNCTGIGCCQTSIPAGAKDFYISVKSFYNHSYVLEFNPCSYALLGKDDFQFDLSDLTPTGKHIDASIDLKVPVAVDWAIGNQTCESAQRNKTSYACKSRKSLCNNSTNGPGYRCKCRQGFRGNPYLERGCEDINECSQNTHNCRAGICRNTEGNFTCYCPKGSHGNGIDICTADHKPEPPAPAPESKPDTTKIILSIGLSLLFMLIVGSWAYWGLQKRKLIKLKQKFFQQNGGLLMQQRIISHEGAVTIFTTKELERATNKFDESRIIGRGGYGMVYKGILSDDRIVAIKKPKIVDEGQIEQFVNEVFILSQINHRNIVKLLGCCLETQVPLLVYEFISNGTLFHHIHDEVRSCSLSLENRLRIASETAGALAYLHSATSMPIFHRDVKSANILLDDNLTVKVSDFGASRLVPFDKNQVTTLVQGTFGYLDPEYFHTGQLTEKSDVYSFGVVLVELLTGEKPICSSRSEEERSLPIFFTSAIRENRLYQVLANKIVCEDDAEQLMAIAQLAVRCLSVKGEERPAMREAALELDGLRRIVEHRWAQRKPEETHILPHELSEGNDGSGIAVGAESLNSFTMSSLKIGR